MKKLLTILKNYKEKKCTTWIGHAIQMLIFHHATRFLFFAALAVIGGIGWQIFAGKVLIFRYLLYVGGAYLILFAAILLIYAFIINPINSKKNAGV